MKRYSIVLVIFAVIFLALSPKTYSQVFKKKNKRAKTEIPTVMLSTNQDTISYIIGADIAKNFKNNGLKYTDKYPKNEPEMYAKYVLSPRIEYELLTPWRNYLQEAFPKDFVEKYNLDEEVLIKWINDNIVLNTEANMHSRAPLSPIGVHKLKVADTRSVNIFYVAVARSLGHMARVNKETGTPQYYDGKKWINVSFYKDDSSKEDNAERGYIVFKNEDKSTDPKYSTNFTIARLIDNRFRTVSFDSGKPLSEFDYPVEVESGKYRLTTGNRQTDGSVLCNVTYFEVLPKEISVVNVVIRQNTEKPEAIGAISNLNHDLTEYEVGCYGDSLKYNKYFDYNGRIIAAEFDNSVNQIYFNTGSLDGVKAYNYSTGNLLHSIIPDNISGFETFFTTMNFIHPTLYVGDKNPWSVKGYASNGMLVFSTINSTIPISDSETVNCITETNDYVVFANKNKYMSSSKLYAVYKNGYSSVDVLLCEQEPYMVSGISGTNTALVFAKNQNDTYVMLYSPYHHKLEQLYILNDQTVSNVIKTDNIYIFATNQGVYRYVIGNTAPSLIADIKSDNTLLTRIDEVSFLACDGYTFYLFGTLNNHIYNQWTSNDSIVALSSMIVR
jgi:hypothetical protein